MEAFYRANLSKEIPSSHEYGDKHWRHAKKVHLMADKFSEFARMTKFGTTAQEACSVNPKRRNLSAFHIRYQSWLEKNGFAGFSVSYSGVRALPDYPELGACPEAIVQIDNKVRFVAIFSDVSSGLKSKDMGTVEEGVEEGVRLPVYRKRNGDLALGWDCEYYYEADGLLRAFPEAECCHFVLLGPKMGNNDGDDDDDIRIISIERQDKYPIKYNVDDVYNKLRKIYFGAVLPEMAHSRKNAGHPFRSKLLPDEQIQRVVGVLGL